MIKRNSNLKEYLPPFVKYPKIPYVKELPEIFGHVGYIFEKIDGSLSQVRMTKEGYLLGGSKSNYISGSSRKPFWGTDFLKWMHSNPSLQNLPRNLIIFGEWLEPVTVEYYPENLREFYFIDLAVVDNKNRPLFFDYDEAIYYLDKWGVKDIRILPPITKGFFCERELEEIVTSVESFLGKEIEGIILKNYRLNLFAKYLHPKYSEIREEEKTLEKKYITDRRVKKAIRRLKDSGNRSPSLESVILEIQGDIKEETGLDFGFSAIRGVIRAKNLY